MLSQEQVVLTTKIFLATNKLPSANTCTDIWSTCHLVNLPLVDFSYCQLANLWTCHSVNLPSCQTAILSTYHFVNLPFYHLNILSNCHFVNLPFCQLNILSNCHYINFQLLTCILPTWHFVNMSFHQLLIVCQLSLKNICLLAPVLARFEPLILVSWVNGSTTAPQLQSLLA